MEGRRFDPAPAHKQDRRSGHVPYLRFLIARTSDCQLWPRPAGRENCVAIDALDVAYRAHDLTASRDHAEAR